MISRTDWMVQGKFGLMVHWLAPGPPAEYGSTRSNLNEAVNFFDMRRFLRDFKRSGADWLIFTIGQNSGYYASPNPVLDRLAGPGRCPRRDLVSEIAEGVKSLGKRFIAYLPVEVAGQSIEIQQAFSWNPQDGTAQEDFQRRYCEFIAAYAQRLDTALDGWWFDGAYTWPVFHSRHLRADWYLDAARAGNPQAAVAFNDGSFCTGITQPVVPGQDYLAGETEVLVEGRVRLGRAPDAPLLLPAEHPDQPPPGCRWHALVPIDCMWAHGSGFYNWQNSPYTIHPTEPGVMEPPIYPTADLRKLVQEFKQAGGAVTFNVGVFQEGGLGNKTVEQLMELSKNL